MIVLILGSSNLSYEGNIMQLHVTLHLDTIVNKKFKNTIESCNKC